LHVIEPVCGWRFDRRDPWTKRIASRVANRVRDRFTRDGVHDTGCTLKAFRGSACQRGQRYRGMHRCLPALLQMEGVRVTEVPVSHRPRRSGVSKYGNWGRLWAGLADLCAARWMARPRTPPPAPECGAAARVRARGGGAVSRRIAVLVGVGVAVVLALEAVPFYVDWLWFE